MNLTQRIQDLRRDAKYRGCKSAFEFFQKHSEVYEGASRLDLYFLDQSLYSRLRIEGKLGITIPQIGKRNFKGEEVQKRKEIRELIRNTRYRGWRTPLQFLWANFGLYENLTRAKFRSLDSGLCKRLGKRGQINFVFPEEEKISESDKYKIIEAYYTYNASSREAEKHIPYSFGCILRRWKEEGLQTRGARKTLTQGELRTIRQAYFKYKGNSSEAERKTNYSHTTYSRRWKKWGLKPLNRGTTGEKRRLTEKDKELIRRVFIECNGKLVDISRRTGFSKPTIRRYTTSSRAS